MLRSFRPYVLWIATALIGAASAVPAAAQSAPARFLGKDDILLYGIGLKVEPAQQTVPKDIATIVSTYLQAPNLPSGVPAFSPDAEVRATLSGPSFTTPRELVIRPNTAFQIPPLPMPGLHTLENIRLVSNGEVLLHGSPQSVRIEVIERLLVTQVTARPLTAGEIRERNIMFDRTNFQAYNFTAAFAVEDHKVNLEFPVLLPTLQSANDETNGQVRLDTIADAQLPTLQTIIPDTLRIQTQVPNLSVVGFTLKAPPLQGQQLVVPPIPGVIAIPGDIGFLNQFFSVMLLVGNVAPPGSSLVVSDLKAEIVLPLGKNGAPPPLAMAQTGGGESPRIRVVVQPGLDGKLGTADDVGTIGPGQSGNAEFLVEGRREGTHVVEMAMSGTLLGLPVGPVAITGRAAGAVLVRNPKFTLTFTHPDVVSAGEPYTLDVTVTNTSTSPANFVSLNLYPQNISGARIAPLDADGVPQTGTRQIEHIAPGDSATVSYALISQVTGKVTAATLDSNENVAGRFALKAAVGELGVPVSPDSLVLPKETTTLPKGLRDAVVGLLGKAWAVATAPPAVMPQDLSRFSKKIVIDRAVEAAEAGLRVSLKEPLPDSAAQLAMDFIGSNYDRLPALVKPADLTFEQTNFRGFDELRRKSVRGDVFASAVAGVLADTLAAQQAAPFHAWLADRWSYRPAHVSVLASGGANTASPYELTIVDANGRRLGGTVNGKVLKEIAFADLLTFTRPGNGVAAQLALLAAPAAGAITVRLTPRAGVASSTFVLSLVVPNASGGLRRVVYQLSGNQRPAPLPANGGTNSIVFEMAGNGTLVDPITDTTVNDPAPTVVSVIQQKDADRLSCEPEKPGFRVGRIVAVLFSEEVTPQSVQDRLASSAISNYVSTTNRVVGVALQPGRRIAFLALRDPIGPFVTRDIQINNIADARGHIMPSWSGPMETTVDQDGARVSGRILDASGAPMPFADVRLFYMLDCGIEQRWAGISAKQADSAGAYAWDYVAKPLLNRILAVNTANNEFRNVQYNVQRQGQVLNVDLVFLGRGSIQGTVRSESGALLPDTAVRVTSLTDQSQYAARTDANGRYAIARVPVGNIFIEAVNVAANAQFAQAENIPSAGAVVQRDLVLLDVAKRKTQVEHGTITGFVFRADGVTPAPGLPVFAYYTSNSQPGVVCPPGSNPCPIAKAITAANGKYSFVDITAGTLTLSSFDQSGLSKAEVGLVLARNATVSANLLLSGGLATVRGTVVTADNQPVVGASVGGGLSLTTTVSGGRFELTDVPVGHREIVAVSNTLGAIGRATIDIVRPGEIVEGVTIVFEPRGAIAGRVVQANGTTPAVGVTVYAFRPSRSGGGYEIAGNATTDGEGRYRLERVPAGDYKVSAFTSDFSDGNITATAVRFDDQVARADIQFRGGAGKIRGVVYDTHGNTPLKARVGVSGDRVRIAGGLVGVGFERVENFAIADSSISTGQFNLSGIFVGPFTLNAVGQFSPDPISIEGTVPAPGATVDVELRLQPTSQIRGTVTNPNGTPVGADVVVHYKSEAYKLICRETSGGEQACDSIPQGIQEENVVTDSAGRFWLPLVNAGPFTLTVDGPDGRVGQAKGSVRPGEEAQVPVRLPALGSVQVRVFGSNDARIPGARVVVTQLTHPKARRELTADDNGVAIFDGGDGFTEGDYVVEATDLSNGFAGRATGRIETDGLEVITPVHLSNATGTVHGIVYAADGFTPVANADVIVANPQGPLAFAVTGNDGTYSLGTIPLGDVTVEVFDARSGRRGYGAGRVDFDEQQVPITIVLASIGAVKGIVIDQHSHAPLKGWTVVLQQQSAAGVVLPALTTTTGVDGRFFIPGAGRGTFTLSARKADVAANGTASGALQREGQVVDVPVLVTIARPLSGSITGNVRTASGAPVANAIVEICAGCGTPTVLTSDSSGAFTLQNVPLGRFTVKARPQIGHDAGSAVGEVRSDGEVAAMLVVMEGVAAVHGFVERADGSRVSGAQVVFEGFPASACGITGCTSGTNGQGEFSFVDQPARSFTVTATDPVSGLKGTAGGALAAGGNPEVRVVLAPTAALSGRVLTQSGQPVGGMVAEVVARDGTPTESHLFKQALADGTFAFPNVPLGPYRLVLSDPVGSGTASRSGQLTGALALGDIVLDEAAPVVASLSPQPSSRSVLVDASVSIVFSEPIRPGTVNSTNFVLSGPTGQIEVGHDVTNNDTTVVLDPSEPLTPETRYTLRVSKVEDRAGKVMAGIYSAEFTTRDVTAPTIAEAVPAINASGVTIFTPIRVRFSEPIDPSKFADPVITVTGPTGAVVPGRLAYTLGNSVLVYTPNVALVEDAIYHVQVRPATDLAGNQQAAGLSYQFATTDRTAPTVELTAANNNRVIQNGSTTVTANPGANSDVLFVDFYLNGTLVAVDRSSPYQLNFQATPQLGAVGSFIHVGAVATDTSGNRGAQTTRDVEIMADQAPTVAITSPSGPISVANGAHIVVTVRALDDLGIQTIGYRALTGVATDADVRTINPASVDRIESFSFDVPLTAEPGSVIAIQATAVDTFGHTVSAAPVSVTVLDSVSPEVAITGATTGQRVAPGDKTTVVVTAEDEGGVASISFAASGIVTANEVRTLSPSQKSAVTSFTVTVPTTAQPGQTLVLDATAVDVAGNSGHAARVTLPVVDSERPQVTLTTPNGATAVPGHTALVVATATDATSVVRFNLSTTGAVVYTDAKQVTPSNSATVEFAIPVPASATPNSTIVVRVTATDITNQTSTPAEVTLTVVSGIAVTLPESQILEAGEARNVDVQLASPAPAGGLAITFASTDTDVLAAPAPITFAAGETSKPMVLNALAGGTAQVRALVNGVERATMTVTVSGGVVDGTVTDSFFAAVAGAQVTVSSGGTQFSAITDNDGNYRVVGVVGPVVAVHALDPATKLYGYDTTQLTRARGTGSANIVLAPASSIIGHVRTAAGDNAGAGVQVQIFRGTGGGSLGATFTAEDGSFEFPFVTLGDYVLEATAGLNRGRADVSLSRSGEPADATITYLGAGTVSGTVRVGNSPVGNAKLTFESWSMLGTSPTIVTNAQNDGTFTFTGVSIGSFTITAEDLATGQKGSKTGVIVSNGQSVTADVNLSLYGTVTGVVRRSANGPIVAGAVVRVYNDGYSRQTVTDPEGNYRFEVVPLGSYSVSATDAGTRGTGSASVNVDTHLGTKQANITFLPQGSMRVTVQTAQGQTVPKAFVHINVTADGTTVHDTITATTGSNGTVLVEHVLAGSYTVTATFGSIGGIATGVLVANDVTQVPVTLQATAAVAGTVFAPLGQAPVAGARLWVYVPGGLSVNATTGSNGGYRIDGLTAGRYEAIVYDSSNRVRARTDASNGADDIVIGNDGQDVERNFTMIGLGVVRGRVVFGSNEQPAGNMSVDVSIQAPGFQQVRTVTTDGGGYYRLEHVPAGPIQVVVSNTTLRVYGDNAGTLTHGDELELNISLTSNAITLPRTLFDANNRAFDIQANGRVLNGSGSWFTGDAAANNGGFLLDIIQNGNATRFAGGAIPTIEDASREIAVRQENVFGLSVTRKVFVPRTGYFARYLEILRNPTENPITVDLQMTAYLTGNGIVLDRTSNGDGVLDVSNPQSADTWFTARRTDGIAGALVFDGASANDRADEATFTSTQAGSVLYRLAMYRWNTVTIPAGGTVAFMHFGVQQLTRDAAQASAQRLALMPPEALAGLSAGEVNAIRNWPIPAGGESGVAALPALTGAVTGRVFEGDNATPVSGASVRITSAHPLFPGTYSATSSAEGFFTFTGVVNDIGGSLPIPIGGFTLYATHQKTFAESPVFTNTINPQTRTAAQDVAFSNTGALFGTVQRHNGESAGAAVVQVTGATPAQSYTLVVGQNSEYRISGLLPGPYTLSAQLIGSGLVGVATKTVVAGPAERVNIPIEPTGTLHGVVRRGNAGASGITVTVARAQFTRTFTTDSGGNYTFANMPLGTFTVSATEPQSGVATSASVIITVDHTTEQDLTLVVTGRVVGDVKLGTAAQPGMTVTLHSTHPSAGGFRSAVTDPGGAFAFDGVPFGAFTVSVFDQTRQLTGEASNRIQTQGEQVSAPISLLNNAVTLPLALHDASNYPFDIQTNGRIGAGYSVFGAASATTDGAARLELDNGSGAVAFVGGAPTQEDTGREIATRQTSIAGVNVTRKVFVPRTGYFARYVDILTNSSAVPVSLTVRLQTKLGSFGWDPNCGCSRIRVPQIVTTSSGDAQFDPSSTGGDRWVTLAMTGDFDPFISSSLPPVAFVFGGASAPLGTAAGMYTTTSQSGALAYEWQNVTVPSGGMVALMHFVVQQSSRAGALASAERLAQLPPEALSGLNQAEIAAIRNFAVPANGTSTLEPLPLLTGRVDGRTENHDGSIVVPGLVTKLKSQNPLFGRTWSVTSNTTTGAYSFVGTLGNNGTSMAIPVGPFTLSGQHVSTQVTATVPGTFDDGQTTATQNLRFTSAGTIHAVVTTFSGSAIAGTTVQISPGVESPTTDGQGRASFAVVAPGNYTVSTVRGAPWPQQSGSNIIVVASATVTAGTTQTVPLAFPPIAEVSGRLRFASGAGVPSQNVTLTRVPAAPLWYRNTTTGNEGQFAFTDIPEGVYTLSARHPQTNAEVVVQVVLVAGQPATQILDLPGAGSAAVTVSFARGGGAAGSNVYYRHAGTFGSLQWAGQTNGSGQVTIANVPVGPITVRAYNPGTSDYWAEATATLTTDGGSVPVPVTLPGLGIVHGTLRTALGAPAPGRRVYLRRTLFDMPLAEASTDQNGDFRIVNVPLDVPLRIGARHAQYDFWKYTDEFTLHSDNEDLRQDVSMPGVASVQVEARHPDGSGWQHLDVLVRHTSQLVFMSAGETDVNGNRVVTIPEGEFAVRVRDINTGITIAERSGTIAPTDDGATVSFPVSITAIQGRVTGHVYAADNTTVVAGARVTLYETGSQVPMGPDKVVGADGSYEFTNVMSGLNGLRVVARAPNSQAAVERSGAITSPDVPLTLELPLPVTVGTISGYVRAANGNTAMPGVQVQAYDVQLYAGSVDVVTDASGHYEIRNVAFSGPFVVNAVAGGIQMSEGGSFSQQNGHEDIDFSMPVTAGSVAGYVHSGDDVTTLAGATVTAYAMDQNQTELGTVFTDNDGHFNLPNIYASGSFTLAASVGIHSTSETHAFTSPGQTLAEDLTIPVSVVKGHVQHANGSPVAPLEAFVETSDMQTLYRYRVPINGDYMVLGAPAGEITVTVQHIPSGIVRRATGTIGGSTSTVVFDFTLPATGTLTGYVRDRNGNGVPSADVFLSAESLRFERQTRANSEGQFTFATVPEGPVSLRGEKYNSSTDSYAYFTGTGTMSATGSAIDLNPVASGQVSGRVRQGNTGMPQANVRIRSSFGGGVFETYATTNANGSFTVDNVPSGWIDLTAWSEQGALLGKALEMLGPAGTLQQDVVVGSALGVPTQLTGSDGFRYSFDNGAIVSAGGKADGSVQDPYVASMYVEVNDDFFCCVGEARLDVGSRQLTYGPLETGPIVATRSVFVPSSGGFARYIDTLYNPSEVARRVTVSIGTNHRSATSTHWLVTPASTGNRYVVSENSLNGPSLQAIVGVVAGGAGSVAVPVRATRFDGEASSTYAFEYTLTIQPKQRLSLMYFTLQRNPGDGAGAASAAQALSNLSDPNALVGLSAAERAMIVNFVIP